MRKTVHVILVAMLIAAVGGAAFASQQAGQDAKSEAGTASPSSPAPPARLEQALRSLEKFMERRTFNNPPQEGPGGAAIRFESRGVDFSPWIENLMAQVRRNWIIPSAAMVQKGVSVVTFSVSKDGRVSDVTVAESGGVNAFDTASFNAIVSSNPFRPLPSKYPEPQIVMTVSFYYNLQPPASGPSKESPQPAVDR